jgi:hypothetical protein
MHRRHDDALWGDYASGVRYEWPAQGHDLEGVALFAIGNGHCALVILLLTKFTPENVHESNFCVSSRWAATVADQKVLVGSWQGSHIAPHEIIPSVGRPRPLL